MKLFIEDRARLNSQREHQFLINTGLFCSSWCDPQNHPVLFMGIGHMTFCCEHHLENLHIIKPQYRITLSKIAHQRKAMVSTKNANLTPVCHKPAKFNWFNIHLPGPQSFPLHRWSSQIIYNSSTEVYHYFTSGWVKYAKPHHMEAKKMFLKAKTVKVSDSLLMNSISFELPVMHKIYLWNIYVKWMIFFITTLESNSISSCHHKMIVFIIIANVYLASCT